MLLELFVWLLIIYIGLGIGLYSYAVFKTFQIFGVWSFKMTNKHIGIFTYPYWLLFWLEKIINGFDGSNNVRKDKFQKNV